MYVGVGPPPPPARQVGQRQPKPPSRHGDQGGGGGGLGKWASVPTPPPPQSNFLPTKYWDTLGGWGSQPNPPLPPPRSNTSLEGTLPLTPTIEHSGKTDSENMIWHTELRAMNGGRRGWSGLR